MTTTDHPQTHLTTTISEDTVCTALVNQRRREILRQCRPNEPTDVHALADRLAADEQDLAPHELSSKQRKRVYIALYQTHLPRLRSEWELLDEECRLTDRGMVVCQALDALTGTPGVDR